MPLQPGLMATVSLVVSDDDLAVAIGSGVVEVLATPRVLALCEQATVAATDGHLADGQVTVGTKVELRHVRASVAGARVAAHAELMLVDGRNLVFNVTATEGDHTIASGRIERAMVDLQRFNERLGG